MTSFAGQMTQTPTGNPEWLPCDGRWISVRELPRVGAMFILPRPGAPSGTGYRGDYARRVGGWAGRRGFNWRVRLPYDPTGTWFVKIEDDTADVALTNPPTAQHPPAGVR